MCRHWVLPRVTLGCCRLLQGRWVHLQHRVADEKSLKLLFSNLTSLEFLSESLKLHLVLQKLGLRCVLGRDTGLAGCRLSRRFLATLVQCLRKVRHLVPVRRGTALWKPAQSPLNLNSYFAAPFPLSLHLTDLWNQTFLVCWLLLNGSVPCLQLVLVLLDPLEYPLLLPLQLFSTGLRLMTTLWVLLARILVRAYLLLWRLILPLNLLSLTLPIRLPTVFHSPLSLPRIPLLPVPLSTLVISFWV